MRVFGLPAGMDGWHFLLYQQETAQNVALQPVHGATFMARAMHPFHGFAPEWPMVPWLFFRCTDGSQCAQWEQGFTNMEHVHLKERAKKLKTDIPAVFLALKDRDTPLPAKIFAAITLAYALSPIDLIPDFVPVLGYLDDIILLPAFVSLTVRLIPKDVMERNRRLADGLWRDGKPKRWYYAVPVLAVNDCRDSKSDLVVEGTVPSSCTMPPCML